MVRFGLVPVVASLLATLGAPGAMAGSAPVARLDGFGPPVVTATGLASVSGSKVVWRRDGQPAVVVHDFGEPERVPRDDGGYWEWYSQTVFVRASRDDLLFGRQQIGEVDPGGKGHHSQGTRAEIWSMRAGQTPVRGPDPCSGDVDHAAIADGVVAVLTCGPLVVYEAGADGSSPLATLQAAEGASWRRVAIAGDYVAVIEMSGEYPDVRRSAVVLNWRTAQEVLRLSDALYLEVDVDRDGTTVAEAEAGSPPTFRQVRASPQEPEPVPLWAPPGEVELEDGRLLATFADEARDISLGTPLVPTSTLARFSLRLHAELLGSPDIEGERVAWLEQECGEARIRLAVVGGPDASEVPVPRPRRCLKLDRPGLRLLLQDVPSSSGLASDGRRYVVYGDNRRIVVYDTATRRYRAWLPPEGCLPLARSVSSGRALLSCAAAAWVMRLRDGHSRRLALGENGFADAIGRHWMRAREYPPGEVRVVFTNLSTLERRTVASERSDRYDMDSPELARIPAARVRRGLVDSDRGYALFQPPGRDRALVLVTPRGERITLARRLARNPVLSAGRVSWVTTRGNDVSGWYAHTIDLKTRRRRTWRVADSAWRGARVLQTRYSVLPLPVSRLSYDLLGGDVAAAHDLYEARLRR